MNSFDTISQSNESTVVSEYFPEQRNSTSFQSEAELEKDFIYRLTKQGYEYISITQEDDLIKNLRIQLEKLNNYVFSENEWDTFYNHIIASNNANIIEKSKLIQDDHVQILQCDNGLAKNIRLIDKKTYIITIFKSSINLNKMKAHIKIAMM